jgi:pimeloyl-ACP methyl ester carboxylesterase
MEGQTGKELTENNDQTLVHYRSQVIALELQGHGHTNDLDRPLTCEQMAADTAALLKQLKIKNADFFGYSLGESPLWESPFDIRIWCASWPSWVRAPEL